MDNRGWANRQLDAETAGDDDDDQTTILTTVTIVHSALLGRSRRWANFEAFPVSQLPKAILAFATRSHRLHRLSPMKPGQRLSFEFSAFKPPEHHARKPSTFATCLPGLQLTMSGTSAPQEGTGGTAIMGGCSAVIGGCQIRAFFPPPPLLEMKMEMKIAAASSVAAFLVRAPDPGRTCSRTEPMEAFVRSALRGPRTRVLRPVGALISNSEPDSAALIIRSLSPTTSVHIHLCKHLSWSSIPYKSTSRQTSPIMGMDSSHSQGCCLHSCLFVARFDFGLNSIQARALLQTKLASNTSDSFPADPDDEEEWGCRSR